MEITEGGDWGGKSSVDMCLYTVVIYVLFKWWYLCPHIMFQTRHCIVIFMSRTPYIVCTNNSCHLFSALSIKTDPPIIGQKKKYWDTSACHRQEGERGGEIHIYHEEEAGKCSWEFSRSMKSPKCKHYGTFS